MCALATGAPSATERVFEATFESKKSYSDPFNDVDVDVIFTKGKESWRVPTFWRGDNKWTVRFAPPAPGEYRYRLLSTDPSNADLNGNSGRVHIAAYTGENALLKQGMIRVASNKRYFEHADGTPFYWLGDWMVSGTSDRMSWEDFKAYVANRKAKGFTVVQIAAMTCSNEERAPIDAGFHNEGGPVWDSEFRQINPRYFDYADRRIQYLVDAGIAPAIWGAWRQALSQMGVEKMKKHWRYVIARYGAYPVFWLVGGEVYDPPEDVARKFPGITLDEGEGSLDSGVFYDLRAPGWTEIVRYVRATDPYRHPTSVHEINQPFDSALQDESLTDFDTFQMGHIGWPAIAVEVAQLNMHYARTRMTKPLVLGEIGFEQFGQAHFADFQRVAFWLAALNGAAGFTYGANNLPMGGSSPQKPLPRGTYSFMNWQEAMNLEGSYQVGIGAKMLREYPWWRIEPHPEWITPRGTTILEPREAVAGFDLGNWSDVTHQRTPLTEANYPGGEWKARNGTFRLPYAAGIAGELRLIYVQRFNLMGLFSGPPTVLKLEPNIEYRAHFWEPSTGIKLDLGVVQRPASGAVIFEDKFSTKNTSAWQDYMSKSVRSDGRLSSSGTMLTALTNVGEKNVVAAVDIQGNANAALIARYEDTDNYIAAVYSATDNSLSLLERKNGKERRSLGVTPLPVMNGRIRLMIEVRDAAAAASITGPNGVHTTPIVNVRNIGTGSIALMSTDMNSPQSFANFEVSESPVLAKDEHIEDDLYDAQGNYRAKLTGPTATDFSGWGSFGKEKLILLDAYRPEKIPTIGDWVLVLDARK